jgi:YHS domain-containing protein
MLRTIIWLLASVLLITFLRGVIGILVKGVGQLFQGEDAQPQTTRASSRTPASTGGFGGELVKDPVCGVFVAPGTAIKKDVRGEAHYFCSPECRDRFS